MVLNHWLVMFCERLTRRTVRRTRRRAVHRLVTPSIVELLETRSLLSGTPIDLTLSNSAIFENQPSGTNIGVIGTVDTQVGNSFQYSLVSGDGGDDNSSFVLDPSGVLKSAAIFDYETQSSYTIRVRSTDQDGLSVEKPLTIHVVDVDEIPPTVTSTSFQSTGTVGSGATQLTVTFSEPVLNGTLASNYELRAAGSDGLLLSNDSVVTPSSVVVVGNTATLTFADGVVGGCLPFDGEECDHGSVRECTGW